MITISSRLNRIRAQIDAVTAKNDVTLLAVSKTQTAKAIRELAACGQHAFGENHLQEALVKQAQLQDLDIEWHFIGPLQSNKCREVANHFDWVQSVDRAKLVTRLVRYRAAEMPPLNVLIQVNIDHEASKSGCRTAEIAALAEQVAAQPGLHLRGLMAIPQPSPDSGRRRAVFARMRQQFAELKIEHPQVDTLSMGMSGDFAIAIAEGASLVRIGTALFGARPGMGESGCGIA